MTPAERQKRVKKLIGMEKVSAERWPRLVKRAILGGLCLVFAWQGHEALGVWPALGVGALGLLIIDPELVTGAAMAAIRPVRAYKALAGKDE